MSRFAGGSEDDAGRGEGSPPAGIVDDQSLRVRCDGASVVHLEGEFDTDDVETFAAALRSLPSGGRCIFDLTGMRFGGSAAVSALLQARAGFDVVALRGASTQFRKVLRVTHAAQLFEFDD